MEGWVQGLKAFLCTVQASYFSSYVLRYGGYFSSGTAWDKARQTPGLLWCQTLLMSCSLISIHGDKVNSVCTIPPVCWPAAYCPQATKGQRAHVFSASFFHPLEHRSLVLSIMTRDYARCASVPRQRPFRSGGNKIQSGRNQQDQTGVKWLKMRAGLLDSATVQPALHSWPPF